MGESRESSPSIPFLTSLPWWVVLGHEAGGRAPANAGEASDAPGYLVFDAADGTTSLAVFTDEDLAERFVRDVAFDGAPLPAHTPRQVAALVARLPPVCTHAAFDPPAEVGARAKWVVPLAEVLRAVRQAEADAG